MQQSWKEAVDDNYALARWRTLAMLRQLSWQLRHTLQAKLGIVVATYLFAVLAWMSVRGFFDEMPDDSAVLNGLLIGAHIWLLVPLGLMLLAHLTKLFISNSEAEPLGAHPSLLPTLARHRVLVAVPHVSIVMVPLFYAYFWQLLVASLANLWLSISVHLLAAVLQTVALAALMGKLGLIVLHNTTRTLIRDTNLVVNFLVGCAVTGFGLVFLGILVGGNRYPRLFESLGNSVALTIPVGMIPFAAALAADEGRWLVLVGWLGLSTIAALWAAHATYRWSLSAHRIIPIDLTAPIRRVFAPVFTGRQVRWLPTGVMAFWHKDVVAPYSREPKHYVFYQVNLLWWGIMGTILTMVLRNRGTIAPVFAEAIPVLISLIAMVVCAMQNGVNALGREGKDLTWLRSVYSRRQLFVRKLLVNLAYVLVHGIVYAFVIFAAAQATSLGTSLCILNGHALGAGAVFACLATSIGFLLPDFERKRSSLPGSTVAGKVGYMSAAIVLTAITGTAHLLLFAGTADAASYAGLVCFAVLCAAVGFAFITAAALRQHQGSET